MPTHAPFTYITPCFSLRGPILIMQSKTPTLQNQPQHAMAQTNFLTIHSIRWPIPTLKPVSALDGPKQVSNQSQHSMAHQHLLIYLQNVPAPALVYKALAPLSTPRHDPDHEALYQKCYITNSTTCSRLRSPSLIMQSKTPTLSQQKPKF